MQKENKRYISFTWKWPYDCNVYTIFHLDPDALLFQQYMLFSTAFILPYIM